MTCQYCEFQRKGRCYKCGKEVEEISKLASFLIWIISIPLGLLGGLGVVAFCLFLSSPANAGAGVDITHATDALLWQFLGLALGILMILAVIIMSILELICTWMNKRDKE